MRIGTPGFVGGRLTQAKEARALSAVSLAELVRVSAQSISHYERGEHSPGPEVMGALSEALNFPRSYFLRPLGNVDTAPVFWRSTSSATKAPRMRAEVRLAWLKDILAYLRQFFDFPKVNIPNFDIGGDFRAITSEDIEKIALACRKQWGLGIAPVPNVCATLETNGVIVARMVTGADSLDAFSQWSDIDKTPYIVAGVDKKNPARHRFDMCHEIAHLALHRNVDRKRINTASDLKIIELQAHRFASAFAMPEESFSKMVSYVTLDSLLNLKEQVKFSVAAMIKRCENLGYINEDQTRRLWINYSRRGWRAGEPFDSRIPDEQPTLVRRSFEMLINEGRRDPQAVIGQLHLNANDVEELACLPNGFFIASAPEIMPKMKATATVALGSGAEIIEFGQARRRD